MAVLYMKLDYWKWGLKKCIEKVIPRRKDRWRKKKIMNAMEQSWLSVVCRNIAISKN